MAIRTPRFRPHYHATTVDGAGTVLLTETVPVVLNGKLNELVCPLIDGRRDVDGIVGELRERISPAEVYFTLTRLEQRGFIEEADDAIDAGERAFWQACGVAPEQARERLAATPVRIVALGAADGLELRDALVAAGVTVADEADATLVATDDYRRPELDEIDARARERGARWGLVKPVGAIPWIGPYFEPGQAGCWRCLVARIRMNYATDTFIEQRTGAVPVTATAALPASRAAIANLAAVELATWIGREQPSRLSDRLLSVSLATLAQGEHVLVARPQCERCGTAPGPAERTPQPIPFVSRRHLGGSDGGHRAATAAETLERYERLVSPITGVVSRLERVSPPGRTPVHAYSASHNWATSPDSVAFLRQSLRSASGGKGTNDEQAKVGAMAEAIERYSGVYRGDEAIRRARAEELGEDAILPNDVMCFSQRQFDEREQINRRGDSFQMVPNPFEADEPTDWTPLWSPTREAHRWVPTGLLYYTYSKSVARETPNRMAFFADSNGCAAGASLEEAALQALLELVERDAIATWWYNEVRRPAVDLGAIDDPYLEQLHAWLDELGRDLWVLDVTNDVGIPVFAAVSRLREPREDGSENVVVGFGAHLEPRLGVMRAITEVNQFFASLMNLGDRDLAKAFDPGAVDWWNTASVANKPYLAPLEGVPRRLGADYPSLVSEDLLEEVRTTVELIERRGMEVLLLDQTRPEVGFPVVKAVVPGMRHFWSRLGPGRLYDVPVGLGWLPAPRGEHELNPTPVFF